MTMTLRSAAAFLLALLPVLSAFQSHCNGFPPRASKCQLRLKDSDTDVGQITRQSFLAIHAVMATSLAVAPALSDDIAGPPTGAAIYAYRSGGLARLTTLGLAKLLTRYEGYVAA